MIVRLATDAMGTRFELVLHGEDELLLRAAGEEAIELIHEQHARLSAFTPGSLVARINALAPDRPVGVDRELWDLLDLCARVRRLSNGAFDPAVGHLMQRWGFRGPIVATPAPEPAPGFAAVKLDANARTVQFLQPGVSLDLGGVAKGYALDLAAAHLRQAGVERALVHGGTSTSVAIGAPPGLPGWVVQVPGHTDGAPPIRAILADCSLSVSSPSGRTAGEENDRVGHIMDPATGAPVRGATTTAVVGESAAETDAWSTALVVLGERPASMPIGLVSAILARDRGWVVEPGGRGALSIQA